MILLADLDSGHSLRNRPLREIAALIRFKGSPAWRPVGTWRIGGNTYNEVAAFWSEHHEFGLPDEPAVAP